MLKKQITSFYSSDMAKCGNVTLKRLGDAKSRCTKAVQIYFELPYYNL